MALQKKSGENLLSRFKGSLERVPLQFRAAFGWTTNVQAKPVDATLDTLSNGVVESKILVDQTNEVVKETTTMGGGFGASNLTLEDYKLFLDFGGAVVKTTNTLVSGASTDAALVPSISTVAGSVTNMGDLSVLEITNKVGEWQQLQGWMADEVTGITLAYTKHVIAPMALGGYSGSPGNVAILLVTGSGAGYTGAPTVTVTGGGASTQATGTAVVQNGFVVRIELDGSGSGYTSVPTVTISGGGATPGNEATAIAVMGPSWVEVQPIDRWRALRIRTAVVTQNLPLLPVRDYPITINYTLPDYIPASSVYLEFGDSSPYLRFDFYDGYSGPLQGRVRERYLTDQQYQDYAPTHQPTVFQVRRERLVALTTGGSFFTIEMPPALHEQITLRDLDELVIIPATTPAAPPYGEEILVSREGERLRYGMWRIREIFVTLPDSPVV